MLFELLLRAQSFKEEYLFMVNAWSTISSAAKKIKL